jgi:spore maturation protein SpmB
MHDSQPSNTKGRARRVRKNLRQGMALAWTASPRALVKYSLLGIVNSTMPPITVYLGSVLVNRIADARLHSVRFTDMLPMSSQIPSSFANSR